ncbi:MAG: hypothetical protein WC792_02820 [Candidatus Micrarchaeia archaeon]|jgi:uncharacterized membrane protein YwzB
MAFDVLAFANDLWLLLLLSIIVTLVIFPVVFLSAFAYDVLSKKYPQTPRIILMMLTTLLGTFVAAFILYLYVGGIFLPIAAPQ